MPVQPVSMKVKEPVAVSFQLAELCLQGWQSGENTDKAAPICVCLHGWLDNANSFLPLAHALPDVQLLAIDLPGHGLSQHRSADAHYHFLDWVDDVLQLIKALGGKPVHLIGHSMGGMIAGVFAAAFPEYVKSLVLLDSIGLVTAPENNSTHQLRQALLSRQKSREKRLDKRTPYYSSVLDAAKARQQQSDFGLAEALLLAERGTKAVTAKDGKGFCYTWSADLRLREQSAYRLSLAQASQFIVDIQAPTLLLMAAEGIELMAQARPQFLPLYPSLQYREMNGGHHLHMTHNTEVAAQIRHFLLQQNDG